ncbi:NAD(P)/FAD-dependent oxidoreductase [Occultella aeris]|uniref:Putative oxidoreductase CzcO n=1 Tax=Occultella aeris TaxID=2761496 RepID=A0A7M4DJG5_9MICO|nr:NAD(P)/FAD-dependent oxidoreductase [Occultella aeris]VZO37179.1 putative oxidoreductase CzcO [Occultella aeris]
MTSSSALPVIIIGAGQSGLAAARAVRDRGLEPLVLEAGERPVGSWPSYYDSLRLFSPARYSASPGFLFGGDPDRYPTRNEVVDHLARYAAHLGVEVRTGTRVSTVERAGSAFLVRSSEGEEFTGSAVIAATGSFANPVVPALPGMEGYEGRVVHSAAYREPSAFAGQRVVVVGGGNSGVQIARELNDVARLTLATREPVTFAAQRLAGRDLHFWFRLSGFDRLSPAWLRRLVRAPLVLDPGSYRDAIETGRLERRAMFAQIENGDVVWSDGSRELVDALVLATGYRPALAYLDALGALDVDGVPRHRGGISTTHPGLGYVGLELQRSFSSNTLRGVHRDADHVAAAVVAHARSARPLARA